jgi:hypothetical protein
MLQRQIQAFRPLTGLGEEPPWLKFSDGHVKMTVAAYAEASVLPGVLRMPMALGANRTLALSSNQLSVRVLGPLPDQASGMTAAQASDLTAPGSPLAGSATRAAAHLSTAGAQRLNDLFANHSQARARAVLGPAWPVVWTLVKIVGVLLPLLLCAWPTSRLWERQATWLTCTSGLDLIGWVRWVCSSRLPMP